MKTSARILLAGVIALLLPLKALSANLYLTDQQFMHRGAGAFIGEITEVQVTSGNQYSETGTVKVKIISIVAGAISAPTITFPYTRALQPSDEASNWDVIAPAYVSLGKIGTGKSVLIYFIENNGTYSLAPAGNSVQNAKQGLLLGRIKKNDPHSSEREHDCRQVQVEIAEVIYGWVGGSPTISLCVDSRSFQQGLVARAEDSAQAWPLSVKTASASEDAADCPTELEKEELFISFDKSKVSGVQVATSQLVMQLQQIDTQ